VKLLTPPKERVVVMRASGGGARWMSRLFGGGVYSIKLEISHRVPYLIAIDWAITLFYGDYSRSKQRNRIKRNQTKSSVISRQGSDGSPLSTSQGLINPSSDRIGHCEKSQETSRRFFNPPPHDFQPVPLVSNPAGTWASWIWKRVGK
jgi:hypothetical protein